jgi:hypothetical protein
MHHRRLAIEEFAPLFRSAIGHHQHCSSKRSEARRGMVTIDGGDPNSFLRIIIVSVKTRYWCKQYVYRSVKHKHLQSTLLDAFDRHATTTTTTTTIPPSGND